MAEQSSDWSRSNGLLRFQCKRRARKFNALTKTPMVRLRKQERGLDPAQAMIEGMSLAKDRGPPTSGRLDPVALKWSPFSSYFSRGSGDYCQKRYPRPNHCSRASRYWRAGTVCVHSLTASKIDLSGWQG